MQGLKVIALVALSLSCAGQATDEHMEEALAALLLAAPHVAQKPVGVSAHTQPLAPRVSRHASVRRSVPRAEEEEAAAPPTKTEKTPLTELKVGEKIEGTIVNAQAFGAFVNIGAAKDGLLHASQFSDEFVEDMSKMVKKGDKITCTILKVDVEKEQIALTCKEPGAKPTKPKQKQFDFSKYEKAMADEEFITGTVARVTDFGAFVSLEPGLDGLVHISQIADQRVESVEDFLKVADEVQVRVISVDQDAKKLALSMKQPGAGRAPRIQAPPLPELPFQERNVVQGKVVSFTDWGAYVNVQGVECFLHMDENTPVSKELTLDKKRKLLKKELTIGEEYTFTVIAISDMTNLVTLSMLTEKVKRHDMIYKMIQEKKLRDVASEILGETTGKITQITGFGAFLDVGIGKDVLVHISQISMDRVNDISKLYSIGDEVPVTITSVQPDRVSGTMIPFDAITGGAQIGDRFNGTVSTITGFGMFISVGLPNDVLVGVRDIPTAAELPEEEEEEKVVEVKKGRGSLEEQLEESQAEESDVAEHQRRYKIGQQVEIQITEVTRERVSATMRIGGNMGEAIYDSAGNFLGLIQREAGDYEEGDGEELGGLFMAASLMEDIRTRRNYKQERLDRLAEEKLAADKAQEEADAAEAEAAASEEAEAEELVA